MNKPNRHPTGESENAALVPYAGPVPVDTFGGRVHVEWDPQAAVTPLGQLPFFTEFLQVSGLFDPWVESCPLLLTSPNAPSKRDVLGTAVLAILLPCVGAAVKVAQNSRRKTGPMGARGWS